MKHQVKKEILNWSKRIFLTHMLLTLLTFIALRICRKVQVCGRLFLFGESYLCNLSKQTQQFRGINIGNENGLEIEIVQLADDTTLFVKDDTSVLKALETIKILSDVAGIKLYNSKTESIWLGQREPRIDSNVITWSSYPTLCYKTDFLVATFRGSKSYFRYTILNSQTIFCLSMRKKVRFLVIYIFRKCLCATP